MAMPHDLVELSRHLKQERLFIQAEKEQLHTLNEEVGKTAEKLYHLSWISKQQKKTLNALIRAEKEATPEACCRKCNDLEAVKFVDGYRQLTYHESRFGEFLKKFRENPKLVALCLVEGEKINIETMQKTANMIMSSIYGNTVVQEDETAVLNVLKYLIDQQIAISDNPRRLLRKGSCAFSVIFKLLNEGLFSAKLFLTAALHKPVMQLLMEDEWFYDTDHERAMSRFPPQEQLRRFGKPGTEEYIHKSKHYREVTTSKLAMLTERFINSIKNNMYCFPQSLAWIVSQLYHSVMKAQRVNAAEARAMCSDLVFAFFICPAVCDPEPFGITTDAPISYIARHNLMQVAQILQVLAISSWDEIDPKARDLYYKFEKGCMSTLLDSLLEGVVSDQPPQRNSATQGFARSAIMITMSELTDLINFLRNLISNLDESCPERKLLEDLLENIPSSTAIQALQATPNTTPHCTPPGTPASVKRSKNKKQSKILHLPDSTVDQSDDNGVTSPPADEEVLVISLGVVNDCPGMLPEQKVLDQEIKQRKVRYNSLIPGEDDPVSLTEVPLHEKRTRFSLSHDQDSIATSDNLEAISEAASSHSVGSDLENENDNDNLSDMVSANVSGRGTPNISGRDTPSSQAGSQSEHVEERPRAPDLPEIVQKTNRVDVTERFGKFEIKAELERDETKSTVSDTWSTDVLASDSEPPDQNQLERLEEVAEEMARQNLLGVQELFPDLKVSEISETASDAWSTDVLASDTSERQSDRLLELEQDEVSSVRDQSESNQEGESELSIDTGEHGEDTPQPSGCQSPSENVDDDTEECGAFGGASREVIMREHNEKNENNPNLDIHRSAFVCDNQIQKLKSSMKVDRFSEPVHGTVNENDKSVNRSKAVSDIVSNFHKIEQNKNFHAPNPRVSASFQHMHGRVNTVLQTMDPIASSRETSPEKTLDRNKQEAILLPMETGSLASSSTTLVPDGLVSPDQGIISPGVASMSSSFTEPSRSSDSGIQVKKENAGKAVDLLSEEVSDGLKLTEQQNMNLDANRISSVFDLFDPFAQEALTSPGSPSARDRSVSDSFFSNQRTGAFSRTSYSEQGARPKVAVPERQSMPPKISVQMPSTDLADLNGSQEGHKSHYFVPVEKAISSTAPSDIISRFPDQSGSKGEGNAKNSENRGSDSSNVSNDSISKSRTSTDSSNSSLVDVATSTPQRSISFDTSSSKVEEKESEDDRGEGKKKSSFFKSFKERLSKGGGKRKISKNSDREGVLVDIGASGDASQSGMVPLTGEGNDDERVSNNRSVFEDSSETTDDILAKYRKAPSSGAQKQFETNLYSGSQNRDKSFMKDEDEEDGTPPYDPNNLETCKAFLDAKRKLRLVIGTADFQTMPLVNHCNFPIVHGNIERKDNELVSFLKVQLAEAINLQDKDLIAQLHETIRCLRQFDNDGVRKLMKTMKEEYRSRSPYIAYLVRCRQGLLSNLSHFERLLNRVKRDKDVCNKYFLSVYVRLFLEEKERPLMKFISDFQKLTVSDEKTDLVEQFMEYLHKGMQNDPTWQAANDHQLEEAKLYIERNVMSHIYTHAMFPNGDGDIMRDQILHEHMKKLSQVITPTHKDLVVPRMYHYECPWPAAQSEIFMINAYKTPKDKLLCVLRCSTTIMNLLSMANEKSVPAADDFMPVLIFVLIKANPPSLLSTIQYITSFYEKRTHGEEQYWWMQFTSAIEFIKTMDYGE